MKVLGIVRISTVKQELEAQRAELVDFIKSDGYTDDDIKLIEGEGASAIKLDDYYLSNMEKVKEYIEMGGIECVYAWAIDRIGRDEEFLMGFKKFLVAHKVNLKIKNPNLFLYDRNGEINGGMELAFSLFSTMAKQEMEQKKARFTRSKKRNSEQGRWNGGEYIKFGYYVDDNGFFQIDEKEADLVRKVFEMYATGEHTTTTIAREMKELGYEQLASPVFISRILCCRGYLGEPIGDKLKNRYPRIISDERFNECEAVRNSNNKNANKQYKHSFFGHRIVKCKYCGGYMVANKYMYVCTHGDCSNHERIYTDFIDGLLFQIAANEHLLFLARNSDLETERLKNDISINLEKKNALEAAGEAVQGKIERAKLLFKKGLSTEEELDADIAKIRIEDDARKNKIIAIDEKVRQLESQIEMLSDNSDYEELLKMWDGVLNEQQESEKAKLVKTHISNCLVSRDGNFRIIEVELANGSTMKFRYQPHRKFGKRLFRIDGEKEIQFLEYYVKRAD